jgi:hypothetical protein
MRSRRSVIIVTLALLTIPALAGPAPAGGSWLAPERSAYVPAEIAVLRGDFGNGSLEGRIADGPFVAYLLPQNRWINDQVVPGSAIRLGELTIVRMSEHLFHARVEFEVPSVPTGMYHIQYCNEPCTVNGIGDLIGGEPIAIGATRVEARLLILTQRLRWKVDAAAARARQQVLTERKRSQEALSQRAHDLRAAEARVGELAGELAETRRALRIERSSSSWGPAVGALLLFGLGLVVVVIVMARRLRRARLDAELHALTHDEPVGAEVATHPTG